MISGMRVRFTCGLCWSIGLVLLVGSVRAGQETFDTTGLAGAWVASGSFTGQEGVVWTYANARATPSIYPGNPSLTLRGGSAATMGWLLSGTITGGVRQLSATFKQVLTTRADFDIWVNDCLVANYKSSGVSGAVETVGFPVFDATNRLPFTNEFSLLISNRLASGGALAMDDLTWAPFELFVRLDRTGTHLLYVGGEYDTHAEVFSLGQPLAGEWIIAPDFAGTVLGMETNLLTLIPVAADAGKTFTVTYRVTGAEDPDLTAEGTCHLQVEHLPSARRINFEGASFSYNTNQGATVTLTNMPWLFFNVRTSDVTDKRIGATSARFRYSSASLPARMESQETFAGIGAVILHAAYYGSSNRVVKFDVQSRGEGEAEWTTHGSFNVWDCDDLASSVFVVEVQRLGPTFIRLLTTGNFNEIANVDDIFISEYDNLPPRVSWSGSTNVPVGWETVVDFTLHNAAGIVRDWEWALDPPNPNAQFAGTLDDQLQLVFTPTDTNEWGNYTASVAARSGGELLGATSVVVRVVSPPEFTLAPTATNLAISAVVDVWVTNVVLHAGGTNWTTTWLIEPPFVNPSSVSNKSRFRIAAGTVAADVGTHWVNAQVRDNGTGVVATNRVALVVLGGGGGEITNETYVITAFDPQGQVSVSGKVGRVYQAFGLTNLARGVAATNWVWQGAPVTNTSGAPMILDLPEPDGERRFYGIVIRPTP